MKNIHLIPTDKPSRLHLGGYGLVLCDLVFDKSTINGQHIYITSDEEITGFENNIWVIKGERIFLWQNTMALVSNNKPKKIILTTDQDLIADEVQSIDDEFLEWFVNNPSCEEVDVNDWMSTNGTIAFGGDKRYQICNHIHNKIIIPQEEPKQIKCYCGHTTYCDCSPLEEPKQENCCTPIGQIKRYMNCVGCDRKPNEELHICKYCGIETTQPDDECYAKPKQETFEEAAKDFIENTMKFSFNSLETKTQANRMLKCVEFGAKYQAERMYTLEQISKDFIGEEGQSGYFDDWLDYRLLDSKNKLSFREWFEQFKKK
jgi:hypothetical protein